MSINVRIGAVVCVSLLAACQPAAKSTNELSAPERRLFQQASEKRSEGKTDQAIELYSQAAKLATGSVEAHLAIAELLRADNKAGQSLDMLGDAMMIKPDDARVHMEKGFALIANAEYNEAISSFDKALIYNEELGSAYSGKAIALDLQGKHVDAQRIYSEAKARGLSSPAMENNYALSLIFTGKYDEAIEMLKVHSDAPYATKTMKQNIALAYGLKGDVGRAKFYSSEGLDPIQAEKNMQFYKRFTALKYGNEDQRLAIIAPAAGGATNQSVPVDTVMSNDIGFVTDTGKSSQLLVKPNVEIVEIDAEAFEEMVE